MKYEQSHPWLSYKLTLNTEYSDLWFNLGEATSKVEHLCGVALSPLVASQMNILYLAKGARATTAIEGNTLSEEQVIDIVNEKLKLPESTEYLQQEVENIVNAYNSIIRQVKEGTKDISPHLIKQFNKQVMQGLELEDEVIPGEYRHHNVLVGTVYRGAPAEECEYLINRLCQWLNDPNFLLIQKKSQEVPAALIKAIVAHIYLAWVHPFADGNGRTARLLEFYILITAGLPVPAAHLLSDFYNKTREKYYLELKKLSSGICPKYSLDSFINYAVSGFVDGIREQIELIRKEQLRVSWKNYVHETFADRNHTLTTKRQRALLLCLPDEGQKISTLKDLSPELYNHYRGKTDKCLKRDVKAIIDMGLAIREKGSVIKPNKEKIEAFIPWRAD